MLYFRLLQILHLDKFWFLSGVIKVLSGVGSWLRWNWLTEKIMIEPKTGFRSLATPMQMRRMMRTDGGWIGLCPMGAEPGDCIALCRGSKLPVALRPRGTDWELLGTCYVHGIMSGELWEEERCREMWVA